MRPATGPATRPGGTHTWSARRGGGRIRLQRRCTCARSDRQGEARQGTRPARGDGRSATSPGRSRGHPTASATIRVRGVHVAAAHVREPPLNDRRLAGILDDHACRAALESADVDVRPAVVVRPVNAMRLPSWGGRGRRRPRWPRLRDRLPAVRVDDCDAIARLEDDPLAVGGVGRRPVVRAVQIAARRTSSTTSQSSRVRVVDRAAMAAARPSDARGRDLGSRSPLVVRWPKATPPLRRRVACGRGKGHDREGSDQSPHAAPNTDPAPKDQLYGPLRV